mmetsp:Transcript_1746/g.3844  ORF Transcript_1746/g.3844 Transcript_1746/m.3844 type:complete len:286 (-) Transcript_1746:973-1830(-)
MHVHGVERHLVSKLKAHHHHPCDPEEEDVVPCLEACVAVVGVEPGKVRVRAVVLLLGPPDRGERPKPRAKPRVEHVVLLPQLLSLVPHGIGLLPRLLGAPGDDVLRLAAPHVVYGDAVPPPKLPRDAPVVYVFEPVVPNLLEAARYDLNVLVLHGVEGLAAHAGRLDEPLGGHHGLDDFAAPLAAGDALRVRLDLNSEAQLLHIGPESRPSLEPVHPPVLVRDCLVHSRVFFHDVDGEKVVALADLVVVRVVTRSDLKCASTELHVYVRVSDDRDGATGGWDDDG